ncbi:MAG: N-acetylmuramoyl-L-alanine amidase [Muribaculaceae bacterium]|nr:N-acetylmuramoyl-L-alanine amidase [Muribaculaceae bacterium]
MNVKRTIRRIVIHCSAGPASQKASAIRAYHLAPAAKGGRGWKSPGYHYVVEADGRVVVLTGEEHIANGVKGFNSDSIHICYTGGIDASGRPADTRTSAQKRSMKQLVADILYRRGPMPVVGHRDLSPDRNHDGRITPDEWIKQCPCFDVKGELGQ